jgi:hypothetical protein
MEMLKAEANREQILAEIKADREADREELKERMDANTKSMREDIKSGQAEVRSIVTAF